MRYIMGLLDKMIKTYKKDRLPREKISAIQKKRIKALNVSFNVKA